MANNKVELANGIVLIDITDTTAVAADVVSGAYFYNQSGVKTQGNLTFQTIYSGSSAPSSSTGVNGDVYIQTS